MRRVARREARGVTRARFITRTKATTRVPTVLRASKRRSPSRGRERNHGGEPRQEAQENGDRIKEHERLLVRRRCQDEDYREDDVHEQAPEGRVAAVGP